MSKIDWTDKDSVKWFILLPSGHEGPYSLHQLSAGLQKKRLAGDVKIWAEGLEVPVTLSQALSMKDEPVVTEEDVLPPPVPEEEIPPIPLPSEEPIPETPALPKQKNKLVPVIITIFVLIILKVVFQMYASSHENISVRRFPKMSPELFQRIQEENKFVSWEKDIFFKEYLAKDFSHIWLVTASFQQCDVEAVFTSLNEKLLSMKDEKVSFKSHGKLDDHVVEFSDFVFQQGTRIVPGMYEMDVKALNCKWNGVIPLVESHFMGPDVDYMARVKVILFPGTPEEFQTNLDNLLRKKLELMEREKSSAELFWEDLIQKLQTLEAISLQIEQHFLDFLDQKPSEFKTNLKPMVDAYTKKFGSFLTSFVVDNEKYFNSIDSKGDSQKRNYELMVRLTAKKIGFESMTYIEEFQGMKKSPTKDDLGKISGRIIKTFATIKKDISEKLSQVSQDQEKSLGK